MNKTKLLRALALLLALLCLLSPALAEYRTLREGDKGSDVLALKTAMYYLGYFTSLNFSDSYNNITAERVKNLQRVNGLEETGEADAALQELIFSGQAIPTAGAPKPTAVPTPAPTPIAPQGTPAVPDQLAEGEEFVYSDADDGLWIYRSADLQITIQRFSDPVEKTVWFEADIWASPAAPLTSYITAGRKYTLPVNLAREQQLVLGITDDFFGYRITQKKTVGVVIRNGEVYSDKTYRADMPSYPNLEVLALLSDGSMKTFLSNAHTAAEYLQMGATDTFAFGPILVADGQLGPHMTDDTYYHYREARCAIGMIAPYHYLVLVTNGNLQNKSTKGAYLQWLAAKMLEKGVIEAINLDGGGTTALVFMGEVLNATGKDKRSVNSMIGFGVSEQVAAVE